MNDNDSRQQLNDDSISFSLDSSRKNKKSDRTIFYRQYQWLYDETPTGIERPPSGGMGKYLDSDEEAENAQGAKEASQRGNEMTRDSQRSNYKGQANTKSMLNRSAQRSNYDGNKSKL